VGQSDALTHENTPFGTLNPQPASSEKRMKSGSRAFIVEEPRGEENPIN
jgi:hypothetical protein